MAVKTHRRRRQMRGGLASLMPGSVNEFNHGNFVQNQSSVGGQIGAMPNVALAQSGGSRKKQMGGRKHMYGGLVPLTPEEIAPLAGEQKGGRKRMHGGLVPLSPEEITAPQMGEQKGGYFASVLKSALVPFGLMGLNQYAHEHYGKPAYRGKSRLSKKIRSRRNRH